MVNILNVFREDVNHLTNYRSPKHAYIFLWFAQVIHQLMSCLLDIAFANMSLHDRPSWDEGRLIKVIILYY